MLWLLHEEDLIRSMERWLKSEKIMLQGINHLSRDMDLLNYLSCWAKQVRSDTIISAKLKWYEPQPHGRDPWIQWIGKQWIIIHFVGVVKDY